MLSLIPLAVLYRVRPKSAKYNWPQLILDLRLDRIPDWNALAEIPCWQECAKIDRISSGGC